MTRNARFWEWINGGWVKITLRPGQSLSWYRRIRHEEGWSSEGIVWEHEIDFVSRHATYDGRDCDGRLMQGFASECYIEDLQRYPAFVGDVTRPPTVVGIGQYPRTWIPDCAVLDGNIRTAAWESSRQWMRDESAEAMGY